MGHVSSAIQAVSLSSISRFFSGHVPRAMQGVSRSLISRFSSGHVPRAMQGVSRSSRVRALTSRGTGEAKSGVRSVRARVRLVRETMVVDAGRIEICVESSVFCDRMRRWRVGFWLGLSERVGSL